MRRNINNVEIVEPPIEELSKKYSAFSAIKRFFLAGCSCLLLLIIGLAVILRISMGSGPETIKKVPGAFPTDIPIYDTDNIEKITYISGKYKNRGIEIAAFFPKIILSPLLINADKEKPTGKSDYLTSAKNFWNVITAPVSDHRDTVQIEWTDLSADPFFMTNFYKTELEKKGYKIDLESEGENVKQFSFSKESVSGSFLVKSGKDKNGTEYAVLTVNYGAPAK